MNRTGQNFTVDQLADAFAAQYTGRDNTMLARLEWWSNRFSDREASSITEDDVLNALDALRERGSLRNIAGNGNPAKMIRTGEPMKPSTLNRYRFTLQAVFVWATRKRLLPKGFVHPFKEIPQEREENGRVRYLNAEEYKRLLAAASVCYWPKMVALIKLAVTTGARKGSIMGLRWRDIDLENGRAYVQRTKNGQPQVLILLLDVVLELQKFKSEYPDELVFSGKCRETPHNYTHTWGEVLKAARLKDGTVCFHTLRHTHASWLAQNGATLLEIADSMGHKSLIMTQRYSHLCVNHRAALVDRVFRNS